MFGFGSTSAILTYKRKSVRKFKLQNISKEHTEGRMTQFMYYLSNYTISLNFQ